MNVTITINITQDEIDAFDEMIKGYWNSIGHSGAADESKEAIELFSKLHDKYLRGYAEMRKTTPIHGDWIVLERYNSGKIMRAEFVGGDGMCSLQWVQSVLNDAVCSFKQLYMTQTNYAEWELVTPQG